MKNYASLQIDRVSAVKVSEVKDTTCAGDTFCGYFLANLFAGNQTECFDIESVKKAVEIGTVAAACAVECMGAMTSIPTTETVEAKRKTSIK